MTRPKLRPCPWCGTTPLYVEKYVYDNKWTQYRVGCEQHDCDAQPTVDWHYFTEREAIDAWNNQAVVMENESLRAENAKLRELVRDMFEVIEDSCFDPLVERRGKRGSYYEEDSSWRVKIRERVREMGIEVDE